MTRKFFGTDGIRGLTNSEPMTAETALRVGQAAGAHFLRGDHRHRVVIGKDTRLRGYMMESAMVAGFTSVGMDVVLLGPMPTPAVAMLTRSMRADLGVMISASHNPFADNGIKLFGPDGYKLSDEAEQAIEKRLKKEPEARQARADRPRQAASTTPAAATSSSPSDTSPSICGSTGSRWSSIAPTAPPITSRPKPCGSWAPRSSRSASRPTASTSTTAAARPIPQLLQRDGGRERRRHRPRARRRRRPADRRRRKGRDGRRRPADGADRARPAARAASFAAARWSRR